MSIAHALLSSTALVATLAAVAPAAAQTGDSAPPRRAHHALVYDPKGERVLLTGGSTPLEGGEASGFFDDLWVFDGARWTSLGESGDAMSGMRLAVDASGRVHSFGGYTGSPLGVLRVLEGDAWKVVGEHSVLAGEPGFVFDSRRACFVAFGGPSSPSEFLADTWEFDGRAWRKAEVTSPPARAAHAMAFDAARGMTVVFGGMGVRSGPQPRSPLGDTWEFDGTDWLAHPVSGPPARHGAGSTYDSKRGRVILFGGLGKAGFLGDTWSWDGTAWTLLASEGPPARGMGYLAYDARRDRVVLFGGRCGWPDGDLDDTWEWDGSTWECFMPSSMPSQDPALALIAKLGGTAVHDETTDGRPVVEVDLHGSPVTDADLAKLAALPRLRKLDLRQTTIGDAGVAHLAPLHDLEFLNLFRTGVSDAALASLAELTKLQTLLLGGTQVTDEGMPRLLAFPRLRKVSLFDTAVGDAGLVHLHALRELEIVLVGESRVTDRGKALLLQANPRVRFTER